METKMKIKTKVESTPKNRKITEKETGTKLVKRIRARFFNRNTDWFSLVVGERGKGKSSTGISLAHAIDPSFDVEQDVLFSFDSFLDWMATRGKRGKAVVIDEFGTSFNSRRWYSAANILFGEILQTNRSMNLCVICTVPFLSFIDVQGRKLFHSILESVAIDFTEGYCYVKWSDLGKSHYGDEKIYFKRPRINGRIIRFIKIPKVPKEIEKKYLKLAEKYKKEKRQKPMTEEEKREEKNRKREEKRKQEKEKIYKEIIEQNLLGTKSTNKIATKFGVSYSTAAQYRKVARAWANENNIKLPEEEEIKPKKQKKKIK